LPRTHFAGYTPDMSEIVDAQSGGATFRVELDFESGRWSSELQPPPEGEFPFIARLNGKRYEIYSDETFDEVETGDTALAGDSPESGLGQTASN